MKHLKHEIGIDFLITPGRIILTHREGGRPKEIVKNRLRKEKLSGISILK